MNNFLKENWIKLTLVAGFILLVIFYPSKNNTLTNIIVPLVSPSINHEARQTENYSENLTNPALCSPLPKLEIKNMPTIVPLVVRYGVIKRASYAGEFGFYHYDIRKNDYRQPDNPKDWFWASVNQGEPISIANCYYSFIMDNNDAVFKITGYKYGDDTGYYDENFPLENLDIKEIQIYKKL